MLGAVTVTDDGVARFKRGRDRGVWTVRWMMDMPGSRGTEAAEHRLLMQREGPALSRPCREHSRAGRRRCLLVRRGWPKRLRSSAGAMAEMTFVLGVRANRLVL